MSDTQRQASLALKVSKLSPVIIVGLFGGFSIFLSSIEYLLPRPFPFFRYGLANITILLLVRYFSFKDILQLSMIKVFGLGILNGTFASYIFVFSLLGTLGAVFAMWGISRLFMHRISLLGISVFGALISNIIQIICAVLYIFGRSAWIIAPYLLLLGSISGLVVGIISQYYWNNSKILPLILSQYRNIKGLIGR